MRNGFRAPLWAAVTALTLVFPAYGAEDAMLALELGGRRFSGPDDPTANQRAYGPAPALRLVQFEASTRDAWLRDLAAAGVTPIQYIAPHAYVVWAREADLDDAGRAAHVRWHGDFLPEYKRVGAERALRAGETEWTAMLYRGAAVTDAELRLAGAEPGSRRISDAQFEIVGLRLADAAAVERVSRVPGVYALQAVRRDGGLRAEMMNQITANNLGGDNLPVPGYAAWLAGVGVNGAGVVIANVDGGIFDTHPDLVNRMLPCTGSTCGGSATDDHGTHTAGIMAADGSSGTLAAGFLRGQGMAPGANLVEQVYSPTFQQPGGMLELMKQSYDNNADLSGNSWGPSGSPQGYDSDTRQVDVGSRDTRSDLAGDQPLTFVLSFMNGNGGTSTQGTPDEAKNVITIGSTKGQSSATTPIAAFNDLSSNTAHGPALDGRRIPHLVTPGCSVDSPVSATGYGLLCGTSMASPQVSGAVALFIEQYRDAFSADPSVALTKAALVAASQDLFGNLDADNGTLGHRPDSKQGWGRLRADWLLNADDPIVYFDQDTRTFDATGESWSETVSPATATEPMKIVLVWTDAPGAGLGGSTPAWVNNLDLVVTAPSGTYRGNVFGANGFSTTGGSADPSNNIEAVILDAAAAANGVDISVVASTIAGDALPNSGDATDQDFALVCVNCISAPTFNVVTPTPRRDRCGPGDATWTINVGALNGYSGNIQLSAQNVPVPATTQFVPPTVAAGNASQLTLSTGALADGVYDFTVTGDDGTTQRVSPLALGYNVAQPPATTLLAPAAGATAVPLAPTLQWSAPAVAGTVETFLVEVDDDPLFGSPVFSAETDATQIAVPALASETTYHWRVTTQNVCGSTPVAARSFTTVTVSCATFASSDVPQPIGATVAESDVAVTGGVITDVDVPVFRGTHSWVNDVAATLVSPQGTQVNVLAPACASQDNFDLGFDDESPRPAGTWPCPPIDTLTYRPASPLSAFDGQVAAGTWILRVTDIFPSADGGSLTAWSLRVCTEQTTPNGIFAHGFENP